MDSLLVSVKTISPLSVRHASCALEKINVFKTWFFRLTSIAPACKETGNFLICFSSKTSLSLFPIWNKSLYITLVSSRSTISHIKDSNNSSLIDFSWYLNGYPKILIPQFLLDNRFFKSLRLSIKLKLDIVLPGIQRHPWFVSFSFSNLAYSLYIRHSFFPVFPFMYSRNSSWFYQVLWKLLQNVSESL